VACVSYRAGHDNSPLAGATTAAAAAAAGAGATPVKQLSDGVLAGRASPPTPHQSAVSGQHHACSAIPSVSAGVRQSNV